MKKALVSIAWSGPKAGSAKKGELVDETHIPRPIRERWTEDKFYCPVCGYVGQEGPQHISDDTLEICVEEADQIARAVLVDTDVEIPGLASVSLNVGE